MTRLEELELLLQNARLRDELEPFHDEALEAVNTRQMSTAEENHYLSSLLAWERAPVLPISRWFEPELVLPPHETLDDPGVARELERVTGLLATRNIVLQSTGHLSNRQLYAMICRDILPAQEKRLTDPPAHIVWQCLDPARDEEAWLRFYATDEEREQWWLENGLRLPPREPLPFPRDLPG